MLGWRSRQPCWGCHRRLIDTVARLQLDMEEMRAGSIGHQTLGGRTSPGRPRQVAFMSTKVSRFTGVTSWERYRQV